MFVKKLLMATCAAACLSNVSQAEKFDDKLCASYFEKQLLRQYYFGWGGKPTDPMPIPSHAYRIVESKVASAFSDQKALGVKANPKVFKQVWETVNTWGEDTPIKVVVTVDGWQAFSYPSNVPVTRKEEHAQGFYDVFADDGTGVRGHINPELVSLIYAVKLPANDGSYLRALSFYDDKGDLIIGLYASEGGKPQNQDAIAGFDRSWEFLKSMPRACSKPTPKSQETGS